MKNYKLILLLIGIVAMMTTCRSKRYKKYRLNYQSYNCKSGQAIYATDDYKEYKKAYAQLFDSVAKDRVKKCLCGKFRRHFKHTHSIAIIEPLYVNMQNCTGVYARRFFHYNSPRYANGYPHFVFLIDGSKYRKVPEDKLKLRRILFKPNANFTKIYSRTELETIYEEIKYGRIWTEYTSILSPCNIKDKGVTIYNAHEK